MRKHQTRLTRMGDQILTFYGKGLSTREIVQTFKAMYNLNMSATLIFRVADQVLEKITKWQSRPLDPIYPHCLFGLHRHQNQNVSRRDYKAVTADLKRIYQASREEQALADLEHLGKQSNGQYPQIAKSWTSH